MGGTGEDDLRLGCQDKGVDGWGSEGVGGTERRKVGRLAGRGALKDWT